MGPFSERPGASDHSADVHPERERTRTGAEWSLSPAQRFGDLEEPSARPASAEFQLCAFAEIGAKANDTCDNEEAKTDGNGHIKVVPAFLKRL